MLSLMVIKMTVSEAIHGGVPSSDNAKDFLESIGQNSDRQKIICWTILLLPAMIKNIYFYVRK